ncbi:hypothetical protein [Paraburkholderia sp. C35]|uniref:hypothetical protein n=1 Tax=Paraburkholderia sp. C35 TaxID=2126993 RepID=UPI000D690256|nr:hypothetical protein [Paraburkholderia sp. C35]
MLTLSTYTTPRFPTLVAKRSALSDAAKAVLDNAEHSDVQVLLEEIIEKMDPFGEAPMPTDWVLSKAEDAKWRITAFHEVLLYMSLALASWRVEVESITIDASDPDERRAWLDEAALPANYIEARSLAETLYASYKQVCVHVSNITGVPVDA